MTNFYWIPRFHHPREEALLNSVLCTKLGPERYPGDSVRSINWPGFAPGIKGPVNAISPKYVGNTVKRFLQAAPKPPLLWVRGSEDQIVSDNSVFDVGTLGRLGKIPDWPGTSVFPSQPMVSQTRHVLELYEQNGGRFRELVIPDAGHTPFLEKPEQFLEALFHHLNLVGREH